MHTAIQVLHVNLFELRFFFDQYQQPTVEIQERHYHSFPDLFHDLPLLSTTPYLDKAAQVINFLVKGLEFQYIDDISLFQTNYRRIIEDESFESPYEHTRLSDYGIYDVSGMHPPKIVEGQLVFFVRHDYTALPYRVSLPYPIAANDKSVYYELLPLMGDILA